MHRLSEGSMSIAEQDVSAIRFVRPLISKPGCEGGWIALTRTITHHWRVAFATFGLAECSVCVAQVCACEWLRSTARHDADVARTHPCFITCLVMIGQQGGRSHSCPLRIVREIVQIVTRVQTDGNTDLSQVAKTNGASIQLVFLEQPGEGYDSQGQRNKRDHDHLCHGELLLPFHCHPSAWNLGGTNLNTMKSCVKKGQTLVEAGRRTQELEQPILVQTIFPRVSRSLRTPSCAVTR